MQFQHSDTICALATPSGQGAIAVIRVSGPEALDIVTKVFKGINLKNVRGNTIHFGTINEGDVVLDEVLVSVFKAPKSYTGEDIAEISCHGSPYIKQAILNLLMKNGCRGANPGEFTQRAFLNQKMDLSRAEAVADLIAGESESAHRLAMAQMRGDFAGEIQALREQLIKFASLLELELDFSEEDVEFADRSELEDLLLKVHRANQKLIESFRVGNVLKEGVPIVIAGKPNAGKSTLLNRLLREDRAIVSAIEGTTRDAIEDTAVFDGITFRFIDTAGIRKAKDEVEAIGIERTLEKMKSASVVIYLFDVNTMKPDELKSLYVDLKDSAAENSVHIILAGNKTDTYTGVELRKQFSGYEDIYFLSALSNDGIEEIIKRLVSLIESRRVNSGDVVVSNSRHFEALTKADEAVMNALNALQTGITGDFVAMDIRQSLHYLGLISGEVTTDDLLDNIFSNFCIGK